MTLKRRYFDVKRQRYSNVVLTRRVGRDITLRYGMLLIVKVCNNCSLLGLHVFLMVLPSGQNRRKKAVCRNVFLTT